MAGNRIPGPMCQVKDPVEIDEGTMCLAATPQPVPIGFTPWPAEKHKTYYKKVGTTAVWRTLDPLAFLYVAGMEIDVDGAPNAYGPPEQPGVDILGNANTVPNDPRSGEWCGIIANKSGTGPPDKNGNRGVAQKSGPYKGFFISTTSLQDKSVYDLLNPSRYVDATKIPYLALPVTRHSKHGKTHNKYFEELGLTLGDYGVAANSANGKWSAAIFADTKNLPNLGECSVALADALGVPSDPRGGQKSKHGDKTARGAGATKGIVYLVFPSSGVGPGTIPSAQEIQNKGKALFQKWGGMDRLVDCFPEWLGICHPPPRRKRNKA